jgi:HPt (histidine-containing phosphotransfer) domain-containing protein
MTDQPVDLEHLARYTGGDRSLNAEILRLFDGQVTEMVGQLRTILAARDAKRWREVTHTIKGAARGVGAFAMGDAAAAAEPVDVITAQARAEEVIAVLTREGHAVQLFIAEYLAA